MDKQNIIIAGIARAGKTTTARMLHEKENYHHWTMDSFFYAFERNFPQLLINQKEESEGIIESSKNFTPFFHDIVNAVADENIEGNVVFDIYQFMPKDYMKYSDWNIRDIYFLGYPDISVEEEYQAIRKYDDDHYDYTRNYEETYLKQIISSRIQESKTIRKECEKYHLHFVNTSFERDRILQQLLKEICS